MSRPLPPPRNPSERGLEQAQVKVIEGARATIERRRLILELYEAGMTQPEIAARLTRASQRVKGPVVTVAAIEHIIRRSRGSNGDV